MSSFEEFCTDFFRKYFELHPTEAIYYGIEGYDHLLNDYSDLTFTAEKAFVQESLEKLEQISCAALNGDEAIDYRLLARRLRIQEYEFMKEDYRLKSPDLYIAADAVYILTVRASSDLQRNLLSRLNGIPHLLTRLFANLSRGE